MATLMGTEYKLNISVEGLEPLRLSDVDFECAFYTQKSRTVRKQKADMIRIDDDNYLTVIDSAKTGKGVIKMVMTVRIPDADCEDGMRTEVYGTNTGIMVE